MKIHYTPSPVPVGVDTLVTYGVDYDGLFTCTELCKTFCGLQANGMPGEYLTFESSYITCKRCLRNKRLPMDVLAHTAL